MELYMKNKDGEFVPITIECVIDPKEWSNKLVVMRLGTDERPGTPSDEEEYIQALENSEAVMHNAMNASIMVGTHRIRFNIAEGEEKCDE